VRNEGSRICSPQIQYDLIFDFFHNFFKKSLNNSDPAKTGQIIHHIIIGPYITSIKSTAKSSTSASSSSSGISSALPAPTNEVSSISRGLGAGDIAGIGIGCAVGALLIAGLIAFFLRRRRKSRSKAADETTPDLDLSHPEKSEKTELHGDLAKSPSSGLWSVDMRDKPEMFTNANRHEMEQSFAVYHQPEMSTNANRHEMGETGVAATLGRPWSAELPEHSYE
jgi:hypothetical protein